MHLTIPWCAGHLPMASGANLGDPSASTAFHRTFPGTYKNIQYNLMLLFNSVLQKMR
jgi:hypothetical protein